MIPAMPTRVAIPSRRPASSHLAGWVNRAYLRPSTLSRVREQFQAHPGHLAILPEFLTPGLARLVAGFLGDRARYRKLYSLASDSQGPITRAQWLAAPDAQRHYRVQEYRGLRAGLRPGPDSRAFEGVIRALAGRPFIRLLERCSGLRLGECELRVHALGAGDMLRAHTDRWARRRLTFLLYLTEGWRSEYGGTFTLIGPGGLSTPVPPTFNSLVLFDLACDTRHFVTPITRAAGPRRRVTVGGWVDAASAGLEAAT
jgi:Rps23 Pro-64 3,4-dihydroxylase Tpa1-like proline 4-hydroxylase